MFVHGIFGDADSTWRYSTDVHWPKLLLTDDAFNDADIYVANYDTPYLGNTMNVDEVVTSLNSRLTNDGVFSKHREVIFVCHSLGGIVVQRLLLTFRNYAKQVRFIYLFAVPETGSQIAKVGALFSSDPLLQSLFSGDENGYLMNLENEWRAAHFPVRRYCAYEKKPLHGVLVVDRLSGTRNCDEPPIPINEDHQSIVKPSGPDHPSYIALRNALLENPIAATKTSALGPSDGCSILAQVRSRIVSRVHARTFWEGPWPDSSGAQREMEMMSQQMFYEWTVTLTANELTSTSVELSSLTEGDLIRVIPEEGRVSEWIPKSYGGFPEPSRRRPDYYVRTVQFDDLSPTQSTSVAIRRPMTDLAIQPEELISLAHVHSSKCKVRMAAVNPTSKARVLTKQLNVLAAQQYNEGRVPIAQPPTDLISHEIQAYIEASCADDNCGHLNITTLVAHRGGDDPFRPLFSGTKPTQDDPQNRAQIGNNNQSTTVNAPGGIPIVDNRGTVLNPTVNIYAPAPRRLSEQQKSELAECLKKKTGRFSIMALGGNSEAYQYAQDWHDVFVSAGWEIEHKDIPIQIIMIAGRMWSGMRMSVHDSSLTPGQMALIDDSPEQNLVNCVIGRHDIPTGGHIIPYKDSPTGSDLLPVFRTSPSMISDEGKGKRYGEEQAHGSADDRGAETSGGGAQSGGRGAGSGGVEAHDLRLEGEVRRHGCEPGAGSQAAAGREHATAEAGGGSESG